MPRKRKKSCLSPRRRSSGAEARPKENIDPEADFKKKLNYNDKDATIDDPIRLYLSEIGKENLLSAEMEVTLSKQMEDGRTS